MRKPFILILLLVLSTVAAGAASWFDPVLGKALSIFRPATDQAPGKPGIVPAPAAGDQSRFLRGDGTWAPGGSGGGAAWGSITGTLSDQLDLQSAFGGKANRATNPVFGEFFACDANGDLWVGHGYGPGAFAPSAHQHAGSDITSQVAAAATASAASAYGGAGSNGDVLCMVSGTWQNTPQTNLVVMESGYAFSAGNATSAAFASAAGDADRLDGQHATDFMPAASPAGWFYLLVSNGSAWVPTDYLSVRVGSSATSDYATYAGNAPGPGSSYNDVLYWNGSYWAPMPQSSLNAGSAYWASQANNADYATSAGYTTSANYAGTAYNLDANCNSYCPSMSVGYASQAANANNAGYATSTGYADYANSAYTLNGYYHTSFLPAGSDSELAFSSAGAWGASSSLSWDQMNYVLKIGNGHSASNSNASLLVGASLVAEAAYYSGAFGNDGKIAHNGQLANGAWFWPRFMGSYAQACGAFTSTKGENQYERVILRERTSDATETEAFIGDNSGQRLVLPASGGYGTTWQFVVQVAAADYGRAAPGAPKAAGYILKGCIKRYWDNNTSAWVTALVGTVSKETWEDDAAWDANATADNTNGALKLTVTGAVDTPIEWTLTAKLTCVNEAMSLKNNE